jgi:hypothetical protein
MINRELLEHESRRSPPDRETAARILEENEARRRASMVDRHEKELEQREGAWQGFARHVADVQTGTNAALVVIARHLGIEESLPPQVRASNRPPKLPPVGPNGEPLPPPKPEPPKLDAIGHDAKAGTQATYVTLATTIALIVLEALRMLQNGGH